MKFTTVKYARSLCALCLCILAVSSLLGAENAETRSLTTEFYRFPKNKMDALVFDINFEGRNNARGEQESSRGDFQLKLWRDENNIIHCVIKNVHLNLSSAHDDTDEEAFAKRLEKSEYLYTEESKNGEIVYSLSKNSDVDTVVHMERFLARHILPICFVPLPQDKIPQHGQKWRIAPSRELNFSSAPDLNTWRVSRRFSSDNGVTLCILRSSANSERLNSNEASAVATSDATVILDVKTRQVEVATVTKNFEKGVGSEGRSVYFSKYIQIRSAKK